MIKVVYARISTADRERTTAGLASARARGRTGGRPKGLSERYQKIAPEVRDIYERNTRSTEAIREMFQIKSQPTLYKILEFAGANVKVFLKKRNNCVEIHFNYLNA